MCGVLKECLLRRNFSIELRCGIQGAESDIVQACRRVRTFQFELPIVCVFMMLIECSFCTTEMLMILLMMCEYSYWFIQKFERGMHDLTESLKSLQCTLIFVGENSPFGVESVYMNARMDMLRLYVVYFLTGSVVWLAVTGAPKRHAYSNRILPHGI
ncbi:hypothetical protein RchiOBHm_Chr1g0342811 [Rosa chinensis]|uniref:Uncharacterized protein n=1 Tax=Rosa chinensis TaxID=74649 RepID=A0A2P6SE38_ROSCH|nr:hypothetical protein RchiOBHm_Chr1g0342811 [Rosa chinensis]